MPRRFVTIAVLVVAFVLTVVYVAGRGWLGETGHAGSPEARACGGVVAPPTFAQAADHFDPEYDRRPRPGEPWFGSGREDVGAGVMPAGGVKGFHAEQEFAYHRPMRPGETLVATVRPGRTWEKQGRRGGALVFTETVTELRDESGELVLTARFVGVGTERQVT